MSVFRNTRIPDEATLMRAATEALTHPPDSWFSDDRLFYDWGLTIGTHRDDDLAGTSNWERITEDMRRTFPADTDVVRSSHWATGWAEQLSVRVIEPWADPRNFSARDITRAFAVITAIAMWLRDDYPLYDDTDYFRRESEQRQERRETAWGDVKWRLETDWDIYPDDITDDDYAVFEAAWQVGEENYGEGWVDEREVAADIYRLNYEEKVSPDTSEEES